jgi:hypothetical protein
VARKEARNRQATFYDKNLRQVSRGAHDAVLIEHAVLAECTVDDTAQTGVRCVEIDRTVLVGLVEEGDDLISLFELGDFGARFEDFARAVGGRDDGDVEGEGVFSLFGMIKSR